MFVRSHNASNDSRQKKARPVPVKPLSADQIALFHDRFAINMDHVRRVFADN